jgi:hypothetical protein
MQYQTYLFFLPQLLALFLSYSQTRLLCYDFAVYVSKI